MANFLLKSQNFLKHTSRLKRCITMSAQLRSEKVLEEMKEKNPYFEKYASKIAALQNTSPEEFLNRTENVSVVKDKKSKKNKETERFVV